MWGTVTTGHAELASSDRYAAGKFCVTVRMNATCPRFESPSRRGFKFADVKILLGNHAHGDPSGKGRSTGEELTAHR